MAEDLIQPEPLAVAQTIEPAAAPTSSEIVARPDTWYRGKRLLLVLAVFFYGLWNIHDGFFVYPAENRAAQAKGYSNLPHPAFDIPLNQLLGCVLPPAALLLMGWSLYASRGTLRLSGETLHIPGHPPIPLSAIRMVDRSKWERKGIAIVTYDDPSSGRPGRFKLDDFVYQRPPTDQIFATIEAVLAGPGMGETPVPAGESGALPAVDEGFEQP